MDGESQLGLEIQGLVAKTVQYKAALRSLKVDKPQSCGSLAARQPEHNVSQIVLNVHYNIANSPIVGGDLKDSRINYLECSEKEDVVICQVPERQQALEASGLEEVGSVQLKDKGPQPDGQELKPDTVVQEIGRTADKGLAGTPSDDVHDKQEQIYEGFVGPCAERVKGDWSFIGIRVVRGPDWQRDDEDGGCGCVGTVVRIRDAESKFRIWVRWDSGVLADYRCGREGGKFDLRIYDNAQRGIQHPNIACDGCNEQGVVGIRWKCRQCDDYDLCHKCYNGGQHYLNHPFMRIDEPDVPGVEIPSRSNATRFMAFGIFPGAKVVRGPDWKWKDQDGKKVGSVTGVESVGVNSADSFRRSFRSLVRVRWPGGNSYNYRCSFGGKIDLQYFKKTSNGEFFIEHLPTLDATKCHPGFAIGEKVRLVDIDLDQLKEEMQKRCGWIESMKYAS